MAKIDKTKYSKQEAAQIMAARRLEKQVEQDNFPALPSLQTDKKYVLCLKHGDKYSSEYVNILKRMVDRHLTLEYEFVCLTENSKGLDPSIRTIQLPESLTGWWCKPYMFSSALPLEGTILYIDLDVVIAGNLDKLFTWEPDRWCVIRDFTKVMRPNWQKYNSSVIRFKSGQLNHVWQRFAADKQNIMRRHFGDQDWLYEADKGARLWPDSWIQSWKWQIRKDKNFAPGGTKGNRKLKKIENVRPSPECCITVFHGDPNPHNCDDPWVVENWK